MAQDILCVVSLSSSMPDEDVQALIADLRLNAIEVQQPQDRAMGIDDVALIIGIASGAASLADHGIKLAKALINWRKQLKERGIEVEGSLEHAHRPRLDFRIATDEEVEEWLSR